MQDDAAERKGTRSASVRQDEQEDREVVWEFEIEPDSGGDVTVSLEAWRPCDEPGAICTADGRVLSEGISTTVRGPAADEQEPQEQQQPDQEEEEQPQEPGPPALTASFEGMPAKHKGEGGFTLPRGLQRKHRDQLPGAARGRVHGQRRARYGRKAGGRPPGPVRDDGAARIGWRT